MPNAATLFADYMQMCCFLEWLLPEVLTPSFNLIYALHLHISNTYIYIRMYTCMAYLSYLSICDFLLALAEEWCLEQRP